MKHDEKLASSFSFPTHPLLVSGIVSILLVPFVLPFWIVGEGLWPEVADVAHFLGFGCIAILILESCRATSLFSKNLHSYLLAAVFTLVLAFATELVQFFQKSRNGSLWDVINNFGGALCALLCAAALHKDLAWLNRSTAVMAAIALLCMPIIPLAIEYARYVEREQRLPVLFSFDTKWDEKELKANRVKLADKSKEGAEPGQSQYYHFPAGKWSSLGFYRGWRDWGDYSALFISLNVMSGVSSEPMKLYLYFKTKPFQLKKERAEAYFSVTKGRQVITIPFESINHDEAPLNMDKAQILFFDIVKSKSENDLTLSFTELRLLK